MIGEFKTDTVTIKRPGAPAANGLEGDLTTIGTDIKCRLEIARTDKYDSSDEYKDNRVDARGFFGKSVDIQEEDIIEHSGGENYTVKKLHKMKTLFTLNHFEVALVSR